MKSFAMKLAAGGILGLLSIAGGALGQSAFDSKKFFEELQSRGANMPANFDGKKFFEELESRGASMPQMVDMKK
jgi:hypothetical protein